MTYWLRMLLAAALPPLVSCGVKGDPLPPERPTQIGRGKPTYSRAAKKINLMPQAPIEDPDKDKEDEDEVEY